MPTNLLARLSAAEGPSRELDAEIGAFVGHDPQPMRMDWDYSGRTSVPRLVKEHRHYTASIDAALTLVPDGWAWMCGCSPGDGYFADLQTMGGSIPYDETGSVEGATPALAVCTAALRAREAG